MKEFKYSLDKSSKKYICPNCNKRTFVLYIDTIMGKYLPVNYGRCDREQNCNYHKAPPKGKKAFLINFLSLESISVKANKLTDLNGVISIIPKSQIFEIINKSCFISEWYLQTSTINYLNNESKYFNTEVVEFKNDVFNNFSLSVHVREKKPCFHSHELQDIEIKKEIQCNFIKYLLLNFSFEEVQTVAQKYYLTGTNYFWKNATMFWQIDNNEQIRGAKIMLYNKNTGKRIKEPYNHINWLHKALKINDFNLNQCLFGLHQIKNNYENNIAIVESEKTAIIMSIILPNYIWLATGSKGNFKLEILEPIKKKKIIAFPDKGEFNNWNNKASELNKIGFTISVSNLIENTNFENGFDLADYYLTNKIF